MRFWLQRLLQGAGVQCDVIAPSMIPRRVGDRVKMAMGPYDLTKERMVYRLG